jgi:hypothetical protein
MPNELSAPTAADEAAARLNALADAEDIVMNAYFSPCDDLNYLTCRKCDWLMRVRQRITDAQDETDGCASPHRDAPDAGESRDTPSGLLDLVGIRGINRPWKG